MQTETETYNLKGKNTEQLKAIFERLGEPSFRAKQAFLRINKHLAKSLDEFTEFSRSLRETLAEKNSYPTLSLRQLSKEEDGTAKALFSTDREKQAAPVRFETVWLVSQQRRTVCISSQAGCSLNCQFCATGTLPFQGNLETWEIVDQVYEMIRIHGERPTNLVFMGMGEPFYNYDRVIQAATLLCDPDGQNLSARHVTISTAGVVPAIDRFIDEKQPFNLAISLNHPDPEKRKELMDIEERHPFVSLIEACKRYNRVLKRKITFEYVCIPGVNMDDASAKKLARLASQINCKINLIPLNTSFHGWHPPTGEEMSRFQNFLLERKIRAFNRGAAGRTINGACGMLALAE